MPHGAKILGEAGKSLADIYDVEGSVVDVDEVDASIVQGVHDLGPTIASERMGSSIIILRTGDELQTVNFNVVTPLTDMPGITRILGATIMADGDRVLTCGLWLLDQAVNAESLLWAWDGTLDDVLPAFRVNVLGTIAARTILRPVTNMAALPGIAFGPGQRAQMPAFALRGTTTTFGAGTVEIAAHIQIANSDITGTGTGAPSSIGLPVPSW